MKIFRNIRYKLAAENNIAKYLRYAFGEILLVVIGILIALHINNWNSEKKARAYEIKMLTEIRKALVSDLGWMDYLANKRLASTDSFNNILLDLHIRKEPVPDSITRNMYLLDQGYLLQLNSGPYESVKSTGMDEISNDSVRNGLINLYAFTIPWYRSALDIANEAWAEQREKLYTMQQPTAYYDSKNNIKIRWIQLADNFWMEGNYERVLMLTNSYVGQARARIKGMMVEMQSCLDLIDKELGLATAAVGSPNSNPNSN